MEASLNNNSPNNQVVVARVLFSLSLYNHSFTEIQKLSVYYLYSELPMTAEVM